MKFLLAALVLVGFTTTVNAQTCPTGPQYYVNAAGNDAAAGTSAATPWKTIAKINATSFPANSCIHVTGPLVGNLILDGSKMSGPVGLDCGGNSITASVGATTAATGGIGVQAVYLTGLTQGVQFLNCYVRPASPWQQYGIVADNGTTGAIYANNVGGFSLADGNADAAIDILAGGANLTVAENVVSGLTGVSSRDDHGIRAQGYTGNINIHHNTVLNIGGRSFAQGASNGYSGNGIAVGWAGSPCDVAGNCTITVEYNLVHHTGGNTSNCGGPSGIIGYEVVSRLNIGYNEVHHIQPINPGTQAGQPPSYGCDWDGIDLDGGITNASVYNNYTHDNFAAGLLGWMGDGGGNANWGPNSYTNNYSLNDYAGGNNNGYWGAVMFATTGSVPSGVVHFDNNFVDNNNSVSGAPTIAWMDNNQVGVGSTFTGNTVIARGNAILGQCDPPNDPRSRMSFSGNKYYAATFNMGQNCGGAHPTTLAAWGSSVTGGEAGSTFGPLSGAPPPPALPLAGADGPPPPAPTPPPPPPPPVLTTGLTVTAPTGSVSGPITLSGTAGTAWVNVGLFASGWVNVGTDVKPTAGKWTMAVDTSKLKLGANALTIVAFSVPPGTTGGTNKSVPLTLNVVAPMTPIAAALAALGSDLTNATPKTKADYAALAKLLMGK